MKKLLLLAVLFLSTTGLTAENILTTSKLPNKVSSPKIKTKHIVSIGTGLYLGYLYQTIKAGRFLSSRNLLELSYSHHFNNKIRELENLTSDGYAISLTNKYFFNKNFYISGGGYFRKSRINVPSNKILVVNGERVRDPLLEDYGLHLNLGNHFFGNKRFSLSVDWVGYSRSFVTTKKIGGITNGNTDGSLTLLNANVGYSF